MPVPVIAALHGNCLGGGLQIALGADIRFATPDARLSVMEIKWGLIPDMSITRTLPRLVGIDVAKELTFTGRVFSGDEAHGLGLVTRVSDDPLRATRWSWPPRSLEVARRGARRQAAVRRGVDGAPRRRCRLEAEIQPELIGSPNQLAAVAAGFTKQPASFVDPVGRRGGIPGDRHAL